MSDYEIWCIECGSDRMAYLGIDENEDGLVERWECEECGAYAEYDAEFLHIIMPWGDTEEYE